MTFIETKMEIQHDHSDSRSVNEVGYQSWTPENLLVDSYHNDIHYFTTRWDALCPYIDVTEEMLAQASKPLIVYALPPDSAFGQPIRDWYGLVEVSSNEFWTEPRRERKFRELDKFFRTFDITESVVPGKSLSVEDIYELGGEHFANYEIDPREIEGFVDYIRNLDVLIYQVRAPDGELVLSDVSIIMPRYQQVYGSFCQWNRKFKNKSPGLFACLLASRWAAKNGYNFYNLGPVGDYGYKSLFVTHHEPIYSLVLADPDHPLVLDPESPVYADFEESDLNQIYRTRNAPTIRAEEAVCAAIGF